MAECLFFSPPDFRGLAEATLFFVVPDVLLSAIALRNSRAALRCCAIASIFGLLTATPYKVYAVQASAAGIPLWLFLGLSPIARLPRFLLATPLAAGAARLAGSA